ncbi:MAG: hypothetical protein IJJ20_08880, partial [Thermoguttaceae bacterium]|nr:hypothetical protein [Thermoguttaceae bacterium]
LTAPKKKRITVLTLYDLLLPDCKGSCAARRNERQKEVYLRKNFIQGGENAFFKKFFFPPPAAFRRVQKKVPRPEETAAEPAIFPWLRREECSVGTSEAVLAV